MAPEPSRLLRRITFVLLTLASAATEVSAAEGRALWANLTLAGVWVSLAAGLSWVIPAPKKERRGLPRLLLFVLVMLAAGPFLIEPFRRQWTDDGSPLELQMVFALRNLGLGLAAFAIWSLCLRLACIVSLFLMLFAVSMTEHRAVLFLLGLYSAAGSVWLMVAYWARLRWFLATPQHIVALEVESQRERLPWLALFLIVGMGASILGLLAAGPQRAARALGEWLPTSGGTGGYDPFAHGGVNDGDDEVRGENARSTGMVPSDAFLNSPLPSLYDMLNDMYGEPFKVKEQERAIALDPQTRFNESKKPPADNLRPNREFPITRKSPRQPRDPSDRAARALFEVQGRTPLHVRVTAFDTFDGLAWREAPVSLHACLLDREPNSCWMKIRQQKPAAIFADEEAHQFKIASSLGSLVPSPLHLVRFRVGRVNRADFFAWGQEYVLRMAERKTPAGIIVETECRTVDPQLLTAVKFAAGTNSRRLKYTGLPASLNSEAAALARRWAGDPAQDWPRIDAIVRHLRTEYVLDPSARVPDDCVDPLGYFLLHSRRGPDYQFATAATMLLRTLGYPTRLVSGFYVSSDHYDPVSRHTPVVQEDLHFWTEVMLPSGDWLVIEPTPGYEVPGPSLPWVRRMWNALVDATIWLREHALGLSLGLIVLSGVWWQRWRLCDALAVWLWRCAPGRTWQVCVRRALLLLECRARWAGRPRRLSQTFSAWLHAAAPAPLGSADLEQLTRMAEWSAYAAELAPPWIEVEVKSLCRRALGAWTLQRWRKPLSADSLGGP